jgi:antitoxin component YwqK of YwqJK toxin-antitoxin module
MKLTVFLIAFIPLSIWAQKNIRFESSIELIQSGIEFHDKEEFDRSIELFEKVPINDTNYALAQYELGLSYIGKEQFKKAQDVLSNLIDYPIRFNFKQKVYMMLGNAYDMDKQPTKALEVYNSGLALYPHQHNLLYNRGVCYESLKQWDNAMKDYQAAILGNPYHALSHWRLGILAANNERYDQAMLSLMTFLWLDPTNSHALEAIRLLDAISEGSHEKEDMPVQWFQDNPDYYADYNEFFVNKTALQNNYKVKFTLTTYYARQFHLFLKNNNYVVDNPDFWNQHYMRFYDKIWKAKKIDNLIMLSLLSLENENVQAKISQNQTKLKAFYEQSKEFYSEANVGHFMDFEGAYKYVNTDYSKSSGLTVIGILGSDNKTLTGNYYYFHSNGLPKMVAQYDSNGNPTGTWKISNDFDGKIERTVEFLGGDKRKVSEFYHSGELWQEYTLAGDNVIDTIRIYYQNGQIREKYMLKNGQKEGLYQEFFADGSLSYKVNYINGLGEGEYLSYFSDGTIEDKFTMKAGKVQGVRLRYFNNGQLRQSSNYVDDLFEGEVLEYYMNGKLKKKSNYKKGKSVGLMETYYANGKIESSTTLDENGKESGKTTMYDLDGVKFHEFEYNKGDMVKITFFDKTGNAKELAEKKGKRIEYTYCFPTGSKKVVGAYVDGEKDGKWDYFDFYGNLESTVIYKKGIQTDSVVEFHENGQMSKKYYVKDGETNGLYLEYNKFGDLTWEAVYTDGEQDGQYFTYYNNGRVEEEGFFVKGQKFGLIKEYDANGMLSTVSEYDRDREISVLYLDTLGEIMNQFKTIMNGPVEIYSADRKFVKYKGNFTNGLANGKTTFYGPNNLVISEGNKVLGENHGEWKWYHYNGKLKEQSTYVYGAKNGLELNFDEDGNKYSEFNWEYGYLNGPFKFYHENGKVSMEGEYYQGNRHGKVTQYAANGEVMMFRYYDKGIMVGYSYLGTDGKEVAKISLQGNELKVTCYYKNGKKSVQGYRKNGLLEGDYIEYHPNGQVAEKSIYKCGEEQGKFEVYSETGVKLEERVYEKGYREGPETIFYASGKVKKKAMYTEGNVYGDVMYYTPDGKVLRVVNYYDGDPLSIR